MKKIKLFIKKNYIIIIPFFTTLFLYLISAIVNKIYPFGEETFIYSDMAEQYVVFFSYVKKCILSGNNLFSSFSFSLGQNFYGIFTYFCASPLNIIFLLSNNETMPTFILLLVSLKISLASMNMAILLKQKLKSNISIFIFSVLYGLMTYNLIYSVNIMWLDPVYMLPLIILGFEKLFKGQPSLYLIALTYAICSNYYISFSICIFLIIYFINYELLNKGNFKKHLLLFIKYSLIAAAISAVILIPTVFNMLDGKFVTTETDFSLNVLYNPFHLLYKFMVGEGNFALSDLPFITSSLLVLLLSITYIFNKNFSVKDKLITVGTIALLILITTFGFTDTIMHCFRIPNQFSFRYGFIISFFLIMISSKNFDNYLISKKNIFVYLLVGFIVFSYLNLYLVFKTIASSILILLYFFTIHFVKEKKYIALLIIPILIGELFVNISESFKGKREAFYDYSQIYKYEDEIEKLKPSQNEFYRITGKRVTFNDSLFNGYYGITSFSPTISVNSNHFLKDYLGQPLYNSYSVEYISATDFSDSLLGIKYKYTFSEEFEVYENNDVFPVLFKITQNDRFKEQKTKIENQNSLYKYLTNTDENLFELDKFKVNRCKLENNKLYLEEIGFCNFLPEKKDSQYYIELADKNLNVVPSYEDASTNEYYGRYMILDLSHKAQIFVREPEAELEYIYAYKMDKEKLSSLSKKLNENKLNITFHNQSKIKGNITNDLENQIIFTTIPYDEGWHVKINGKEVKTFKNLESLLAFEIPQGDLEIELFFIPKGYILGLTITLFTIDVLIAFYVRKNKEN